MSSHIEQVSAREAFARAKQNALRRYPTPQTENDRLYPLATPVTTPSFQIQSDESFFAIGSCFARNIETALLSAGMDVSSAETRLGPVGESLKFVQNFFNKYSVHSIYNDLKWALEPDTFPGQEILYHVPGKDWYADLQLGVAKLNFPPKDILDFRRQYLDVMARVATSDVVIITLGYVETWFDKQLGVYLNTSPPLALVNAEPDRFEFRVLSYDDVLSGLHDIYDLLLKYRKKPLKMLLTVSPVPLLSTFRDMDVLLANTYSKSVQRAAIDAFIRDTKNVDYFPSYEFVTLSNPIMAWQSNDYRHVSIDLVTRIMDSVMSQYITTAPNMTTNLSHDEEVAYTSIRLLTKAEDYTAIVALAKETNITPSNRPDMMVLVAEAYAQTGDLQTAFDILRTADKHPKAKGGPLEGLIRLAVQIDSPAVTQYLQTHETRYPKRFAFRNRVKQDLGLP